MKTLQHTDKRRKNLLYSRGRCFSITFIRFNLCVLTSLFLIYYIYKVHEYSFVQERQSNMNNNNNNNNNNDINETGINDTFIYGLSSSSCLIPSVPIYSEEVWKLWKVGVCNRTCRSVHDPVVEVQNDRLVALNQSLCPEPRTFHNIVIQSIKPSLSKGLNFNDPVTSDYVFVKCHKEKYFIAKPRRKEELVNQRKALLRTSLPHPHINIIGIGFDSMSHANMIRNLPKTLQFLRTRFNRTFYELNGYNVVGDGTTQNLGGILFGNPESDLPEARQRIKSSNYVDQWPWIWRFAAPQGYLTSYMEDEASLGAFSLRLKGFRDQPTDYFTFTFWKAASLIPSHVPCRGGMWDWYRQLRFAVDVLKLYPDLPHLMVVFSKVSHIDCMSELIKFDEQILSLLEEITSLPCWNNTLFFLFGDHGPRFGFYRQTLQGKLEERLAAMFIKVPEWFPQAYPDLVQHLDLNQHTLTTPFTIYGTILHALNLPDGPPSLKSFQASLFTPLGNRSCDDARVDGHWCSCKSKIEVPVDSPIIEEGTLRLIDVLNERIMEHGEGRCERVNLYSILRVQMSSFTKNMLGFRESADNDGRTAKIDKVVKVKGVIKEYDVQFQINGGGILEGDFDVLDDSEIHRVGSHFSRVNAYGNLPCHPKPLIREFCVCMGEWHEEQEQQDQVQEQRSIILGNNNSNSNSNSSNSNSNSNSNTTQQQQHNNNNNSKNPTD